MDLRKACNIIAVVASVVAADFMAVSWGGGVYTIDEQTGAGSYLGNSGFSSLNALAVSSTGVMYAFSGTDLITIDQTTGAGTLVSSLSFSTPSFNGVRGLAMDASDRMYAVADVGPLNSLGPDELFSIDLDLLTTQDIGSTGSKSIQGLEFGTDGTLFAWDLGNTSPSSLDGLLSLDLGTGAATDSWAAGGGYIQTLGLGSNNGMYAVGNSNLYTVDLTTGGYSLVGSGDYSDIRGIARMGASPVPEPSILSTLFLGLLSLSMFYKRRRKLN